MIYLLFCYHSQVPSWSSTPSPQVCYSGLVENVRVRRAKYAYWQCYDLFLRHYKFICPSIWPNPRNGGKEGTSELISYTTRWR